MGAFSCSNFRRKCRATGEVELCYPVLWDDRFQLLLEQSTEVQPLSELRGRAFIRSRAEALLQFIVVATISTGYYLPQTQGLSVSAIKNKTVERREKTMKASRHNGRSGKHGVYDVKHNDRDFDVEHSEHIDSERTKQNVYWDCYQGYSFAGSSQERQFNFTEIERAYYYEHYSDFVDAQNERNEQARHPERNRTIDDVLKNNKTCPEESVIQLGNIDHAVTPDVLAK